MLTANVIREFLSIKLKQRVLTGSPFQLLGVFGIVGGPMIIDSALVLFPQD